MNTPGQLLIRAPLLLLLFGSTHAQIDDICREAGVVPSLDSPFANVPYIYGRITVTGSDPQKPPKTTVIFSDREQSETRWTVGKSGNYCFKRNNASGGLLVIEVNGTEVARKTLPTLGPNQQREDFEVMPPVSQRTVAPSTVSAKYARPPNEKTTALYRRASDAEKDGKTAEAIKILVEITAIDPEDFIAFAKLGTLQFVLKDYSSAEAAFRKALELRIDYVPVWINVGMLRFDQKQFEAAIEIFKHTVSLEPSNARVHQMLGESYLQSKLGSLAVEEFDKALELDPIGMAECHLRKGKLFELAGAKAQASREYKLFIEKVPNHPDRKKLEKYIKDNPSS